MISLARRLVLVSFLALAPACPDDDDGKSDSASDTPADDADTADATDSEADSADTREDDGADTTDSAQDDGDVAADTADVDAAPDDGIGDTGDDTTDTTDAAEDTRDTSDASDAGDGDEWAGVFDVPALLAGARSDVPDAIMNKWPALLGGQMTRHSAITGIEFHIPGVVSSAGLSPTPIPIKRRVNGVEYWQVTGEISARVIDDWGVYYAVGPIDGDGVNHRAEVYDPFEPTEADPDDPASHPRAGLPGAIFVIRWPVEGFNGAIVQMQPAADGGHGYPQAVLAWWPVDALVLMSRGYAVATVSAGSTVYARKEADGTLTVDTNPESGSGIFYTQDAFNPDEGVYETERHKLVSNLRTVTVDAAMVESPIDRALETEVRFPGYDPETDTWFVDAFVETLGRDNYTFPIGFQAMEIISDAIVLFKSFMTQVSGVSDPWALYLGWSGSGFAAWNLVTGAQAGGGFQFEKALGTPPSGGNFRTWGDPSSGRRFDAFLVYGSVRTLAVWQDSQGFDEIPGLPRVDPDHPLGAPIVYLRGDADVLRGDPVGETFWTNTTVMANAVARAWPTSQMADEPLEDFIAIYELEKLTHQVRDQLFPVWDLPPYDVDALWYDPALGYAPEALNQVGRGLRLNDLYARQHLTQEDDQIQGYAGDLYTMPRITPLFMRLFDALRALTEQGTKLPVSRVGPLFTSVDALDETTLIPPYPAPCTFADDAPWEEFLACRDGIDADSTWSSWTLSDFEIAAVHEFVSDNPLPRRTDRVVVPDVAAPLGWYFMLFGAVNLRRDFTNEELMARYTDHAGYVAAFSAATEALIEADLWDEALGRLEIEQAGASDVLVEANATGECSVEPNPSCAATDCCEEASGHQRVCCAGASLLALRYCTGPGTCPDGGTYPECEGGTVECPHGSAPCEPGATSCCNACGAVGPRGCSVCETTPYTVSCDVTWDGQSCTATVE